ncbi:MAG: hypothetical protein AAF740_06645 [Bacteroidota bacterium]
MKTIYKIFVALFLLSQAVNLWAQKLEKSTVKVSYIQQPLRPLDRATYQTYSRSVFRGFTEIDNERNLMENNLKVDGFRPVLRNADFHIELMLKGLNLLTTEEQSDEDDGRRSNFGYQVTYEFPALLIVTARDGKVLDRIFLQEMQATSTVQFGGEFTSSAQLQRAWTERKYEFLLEEEERNIRQAFSQAREMLASQYAYQTRTDKIQVAYGSGKQDYSDLEQARDLAREGYGQLTLKNYDAAHEKLEDAIDIWLAAIAQGDADNRKSRINKKILRWLHHNCANAYLWLGQYEQARLHNRQSSSLGLVLNPLSDEFINDMEMRANAATN